MLGIDRRRLADLVFGRDDHGYDCEDIGISIEQSRVSAAALSPIKIVEEAVSLYCCRTVLILESNLLARLSMRCRLAYLFITLTAQEDRILSLAVMWNTNVRQAGGRKLAKSGKTPDVCTALICFYMRRLRLAVEDACWVSEEVTDVRVGDVSISLKMVHQAKRRAEMLPLR